MIKKCAQCQHLFDANTPSKKYCSDRCRWMGTHGMVPPWSMLPKGAVVRPSYDYHYLGTCEVCGGQYHTMVNFVSRHSIKRRRMCDRCMEEKRKEMGRRCNSVVKRLKCVGCGVEIEGHTSKKYCKACSKIRRRESWRKHRQRKMWGKEIDPKYLRRFAPGESTINHAQRTNYAV